ncbi:uncharacterized protein MYCFIDRAFT_206888 [Pseudocercospora fijiensis CIRAD86]|uniref:ZZ-type domain-containing protein n=1 Tax=Pseudocercospora fijiensis (strain CIRAD86) TaxID=383855 RepID=M3A6B0_PSEFD|nr:uncharacterized protein MYCFIDRAFT_206888 [Pseudocercospora fijiensis CIRAD86]EME86644.1 hypothetical protein MYCFIDRAFT_206888 [Pseudocercospora fijiensis CIRAD86]
MNAQAFQADDPGFSYTTLSAHGVFSANDRDYLKLFHNGIVCDGKRCRTSKPHIADFDLCLSCARDKGNGHNASHEFFRCVVPPKIADPIVAERKSRDSDPASIIQKGDRCVDTKTGERKEAGELLEDMISARDGSHQETTHETGDSSDWHSTRRKTWTSSTITTVKPQAKGKARKSIETAKANGNTE